MERGAPLELGSHTSLSSPKYRRAECPRVAGGHHDISSSTFSLEFNRILLSLPQRVTALFYYVSTPSPSLGPTMLQEDGARVLLWLCLVLARCHEPPSRHGCDHHAPELGFSQFCLVFHSVLPPAVIYNPCGCLGLVASQLMIFSTLGWLDFPHYTEEPASLSFHPACYFELPSEHAAPFSLGRRRRACMTPLSPEEPAPWPLACCCVICGLRRAPLGVRGLRFPWSHEGAPPMSVWGAGREAHTGDSFVLLLPWRRAGALETGRQMPPPTRLRCSSRPQGRTGVFRTPAICSEAPGKKSFHDSLKSYSLLPPLSLG